MSKNNLIPDLECILNDLQLVPPWQFKKSEEKCYYYCTLRYSTVLDDNQINLEKIDIIKDNKKRLDTYMLNILNQDKVVSSYEYYSMSKEQRRSLVNLFGYLSDSNID